MDNLWLAILAACRTGRPTDASLRQGLTGLGVAFTAAGADAIVVTQWQVTADATNRVVPRLLELIQREGRTLSQALQLALREYQGSSPDIFEWGAFNILGDGSVTLN